jgi:hypothetical protein
MESESQLLENLVDKTCSQEDQSLQKEYIELLSEKEKKAILIAASHLGMSFQLKKSVAFLKWKKSKIQ